MLTPRVREVPQHYARAAVLRHARAVRGQSAQPLLLPLERRRVDNAGD